MDNYLFKSERLGFRQWLKQDRQPFVAMNKDPQVMEYLPGTLSSNETFAMIKRIHEHFQDHGYGLYAIDLLETNSFIGYIGFQQVRFNAYFTPAVEIGYRLHPDLWGVGLATEGAKTCVLYGFDVLKLGKIVSFTSVLNRRSERVMKKIGMIKTGEFHHPVLPENHRLRQHVLYEIVPS